VTAQPSAERRTGAASITHLSEFSGWPAWPASQEGARERSTLLQESALAQVLVTTDSELDGLFSVTAMRKKQEAVPQPEVNQVFV